MEKTTFKEMGISLDIIRALDMLGYKEATEVQERVIPIALEGRDIIVKSQTGSGKTAAFGIPISMAVDIEGKRPQALVLSPTRELAVQVKDEIANIGRIKRIRCAAIYGKEPISIQERELKQRVHVVVGTPGRTMDHIKKENIDLVEIKYLIIDEADKMLNMGFIEQVEDIIKLLPKDRITMLFSATMSEEIEGLCTSYMNDPEKVEIFHENPTTERIIQGYYEVEERNKFELLCKAIYVSNPDSAIIFCNTKEEVDILNEKMRSRGFLIRGLHGGMEQKDRLETINAFKAGKFPFLVATDVAARGIHIDEISLVINYNVPVERESYVHRIGRTGRAGVGGKAITLITSKEHNRFKELEEYIGYNIPLLTAPNGEEVEHAKALFKEKAGKMIKPRVDKGANLNKSITRIHINAGKKKKIRPGDIAGTISNIAGVNQEDVGIIDVQDTYSYVDVLNGKGELVLKEIENMTLKGKKVKAERALKGKG